MGKYKVSRLLPHEMFKFRRSHSLPDDVERKLPFSEAMTVLFGAVFLVFSIIVLTQWLMAEVEQKVNDDMAAVEGVHQDVVSSHPLPASALITTHARGPGAEFISPLPGQARSLES